MAFQPKLVNKQFNSPINLYSQQNIQEILERDTQILANGAVGINFYNPGVGKAANLQNSAVLRMLEEEENRRNNGHYYPGNEHRPKRLLRDHLQWPPPDYEQTRNRRSTFKDVVFPGAKRVAWPPQESEYTPEPAVHEQGGALYSSKTSPPYVNGQTATNQPVTLNQNGRAPLKPLNISCNTSNNQQNPKSPVLNQSPVGFKKPAPSSRWAPVHSPTPVQSPQLGFPQPSFGPSSQLSNLQNIQSVHPQPYSANQQPAKYQAPSQQISSAQFSPHQSQQSVVGQFQAPSQNFQTPPIKPVEPPPTTIILRPQAPVSQASPPVFASQPATATLKGGKHLRGDLKWPPETVKKQTEEENRARLELAKGPVFRPRRVNKDYTSFFAQHALNSSYPGYRAPPGTQYYNEQC